MQETFNLRMEFNDQNHEEKILIDQEFFMLKNKIGQLEHEIEDKESEIRRVQIDLDMTRNAPNCSSYQRGRSSGAEDGNQQKTEGFDQHEVRTGRGIIKSAT